MIIDSLTNRDNGYFYMCLGITIPLAVLNASSFSLYVRIRRRSRNEEFIYISNKFHDWLQNRNLPAYVFEEADVGMCLYVPMSKEQELEFNLQWL